MSIFELDELGAGHPHIDKAARKRMQHRSEHWRRGLAQRENWNEQQYEEERLRLENEIRNWPDRKAA